MIVVITVMKIQGMLVVLHLSRVILENGNVQVIVQMEPMKDLVVTWLNVNIKLDCVPMPANKLLKEPFVLVHKNCMNIKKSFICSCVDGYILEPDKRSCKAVNHSAAFLIISNRHSILVADLQEQSLERVPIFVENVVATASDMHSGTIFWSDMKLKKISRLDRGSEPRERFGKRQRISVNRTVRKVMCRVVWLDFYVLYVCVLLDWGENPRVERVGMDGTNRSTIINTKIYWPNGLTLDVATKRVYFADSKLDFIDFCYYNGSGRQQVLAGSHYLLHPHSLALFEDVLYWTDRQLNRVLSAHKYKGVNQTVVSHLISQPLSVHVHHPSLQPISPNPCENAPCGQLCLLSPSTKTGYSCKCRPGYRLGTDGKCTEEETPFLLVMRGSQIIDVSLNPSEQVSGYMTPIVGVENGVQIDFDRKMETIFWVEGREGDDDENGTIYTSRLNGGNRTQFLGSDSGIIGAPYTIAFDWLGRNLYIGNRVASNLEAIKVDGKVRHRTIILANDGNRTAVARPKSICLDPSDGKLYWIDEGGYGVPSKVGRVNMDGTNPMVLVDNLEKPEAIAIDLDKKLVYFSTQYPAEVKVISIDGQSERTLLEERNHIALPRTLGILDSRLYLLDPKYDKLERVDLPNADNSKLLMDNEPDLKSFTIYRKRPTLNHPCLANNGGCQQLCIPAPGNTRKCACSIGHRIENEVNCSPYNSFAVVAQLDITRGFSLQDSSEAMVPISGPGHHILHVDVHVADNWIYWVEFNRGTWNGVFRVHPNGSELSPIVTSGVGSNGIRGLAVDWIAGNLYFTNVFPHENYLEVCWLDGSNRKVLVKTTSDAPRELAVNPIKRFLYWIDYGQYPRIGKAYLDGSTWTPIVTSGISNPRDLTVDMVTHDVLWVDSRLDTLQKVSFNGGSRQVLRRYLPNPMGVAVLKSEVLWVDRNLGSVLRASKLPQDNVVNATRAVALRSSLPRLRDVAVFDVAAQPTDDQNPCRRLGNGGCDQLCFSFPPDRALAKANFKCDCATGKVSVDGRKCEAEDEFLVFSTRTEVRSISLDPRSNSVPFKPVDNTDVVEMMRNVFRGTGSECDGERDCADGSDEPASCPARHCRNGSFQCSNGNCTANLSNVVGVDFDYADNKLLFTQIRPWARIAWMPSRTPTKESAQSILDKGVNPEGIAYDWTQKKIYWTDSSNNSIYAMNLDGTQLVMIARVERPRAIVLDPCNGSLYYTDWGSDELNCNYPPCADGEFTCGNHKCIPMSQVCNGMNDCKDNKTSDETHDRCPKNTTCPVNHLKCEKTNICVEPYWLCDGDDDCGDNSDEDAIHCAQRTCPPNSFRCPNHRCIPATWYCDGDSDCEDGSDEPPEYCKSEGRTCFGDLFTCDNGNCIPRIYICDGDNDCLDNSDEDDRHQCNDRRCDEESEYTCIANKAWNRAQCIPKKWICDGDPDCVDGADENSTIHNCSKPEPCNSEDQFTCSNGRCINKGWVCDHDNDCGDASDEGKECHSQYKTCAPSEFSCQNFKCIRTTYRCDGEDDCGDGSDEFNCKKEESTCGVDEFKCKNGDCIPKSKVCDKVSDCSDDSDEPLHCNVNECLKPEDNQCGHKCVDEPAGFKCECNKGYRLLPDGKACDDINECTETPGVCSQKCSNTPGSYYCKCSEPFYERASDEKHCKRKDKIEPWLIFTNKYYIRNMSLDGTNYYLTHRDLMNVVALDYDLVQGKMYFCDVSAKTIFRASINGTGTKEAVIRHDSHGLEGIALDWVGRKLYWLDRHSRHLDVSELNGTYRKTLKAGIADPRAIVVHPGKGFLFFTTWHLQAYIGRMGLDGSNFTRILTWNDDIAWPNALAIDYFTDRLFWADAHLDYIAHSDLYGKHRHNVLVGSKVPHVFALTLFDDSLYWTDWNLKALMTSHKFTGENYKTLVNTTHRPYDVHVVHPLRQPPYPNPCGKNNGGCSHLCLISPTYDGPVSYACACPNQFILMKDNRTCQANCTTGQHRCRGNDEKCIPWYWK
ncbi:hypothetical protein B566_EDAN012698 [Ephemera danica]|nr:hypothetical protein B566_EDAN012698 [Ephemera danica]